MPPRTTAEKPSRSTSSATSLFASSSLPDMNTTRCPPYVFPEQQPLDRTFINTWEDKNVVQWVEKTGRKKLVMAALWTEICLAFPVIHALGDGYEVYFVTDASGGTSVEAHEMGIQRMIQAGAIPITSGVFGAELQRDWAREATVPGLAQILLDHGGATSTNLAWELQLLADRSRSAKPPRA
jgi:hypothetical protein